MLDVHFTNLLIVVAAAFVAPLALGFFPRLRLPAIVLEIVLGIIIGPSVLGWVTPDLPVSILSLIGLAFLLFLAGLEHSRGLSRVLVRLQDTTAQIRVRGAFVLMIGFVAIAQNVGLEVILGAFAAGAMLSLIDRDQQMTHPQFRLKLEAAGFGIFIPVFFVTTGLRFDLNALFSSASTVARVPLFLLALLLVRGLPALLYGGLIGRQKAVIAGVLQATSLPFIVAATQIGVSIGVVSKASAAGLIAAGLLSVIVFPALGLTLLRRGQRAPDEPATMPTPATPVMTAEDRALCGGGTSPEPAT